MARFYDRVNKRLVYIGRNQATPDFWEQYWHENNIQTIFKNPPKHRVVIWFTKKYLPLGAKILEGGCGTGEVVLALDKAGFEVYGVDFAQETIKVTRENWPSLKVFSGDVRFLPFADNFFDGYWSRGVIEHFYHGYEDIMNEMWRVIRAGGYLFLTFPAMSSLRKRKAEKNQYLLFDEAGAELDKFYQFALDPDEVSDTFEKRGFRLVMKRGQGSLTGLKKEYKSFKPVARFLSKLPLGAWGKFNAICDPVWGNFSGHGCLLILKKSSE